VQGYANNILLYTPPFRCKIPGKNNDIFGAVLDDGATSLLPAETGRQCHLHAHDGVFPNITHVDNETLVPCHKWVFDTMYVDSSAATEMALVCGEKQKAVAEIC
jgi:hypothetical protein